MERKSLEHISHKRTLVDISLKECYNVFVIQIKNLNFLEDIMKNSMIKGAIVLSFLMIAILTFVTVF